MKAASLNWLQVHDSNFMIFWKRQNYGDSEKKKSAVTRSQGKGRDENEEGLLRRKMYIYWNVVVSFIYSANIY